MIKNKEGGPLSLLNEVIFWPKEWTLTVPLSKNGTITEPQ